MKPTTYRRTSLLQFWALIAALLLTFTTTLAAQKRPLTHRDYDAWRGISNPALSPDGKFLVYGLLPQEGDGEVVVRNLATGSVWRQPAGARPEPPRANPLAELLPEAEAPRPRNVTITFSSDGRFVVFSTFAAKADVDKAKRAKKKGEDMPKGGMVILDLASGAATRIERVKSFELGEKAGAVVAYLREPEAAKPARKEDEKSAEMQAEARPEGPFSPATGRTQRPEYGSELVLRDLSSGAERSFADVLEYTLSKDGKSLVYGVSSKKDSGNGVFAVDTSGAAEPRALLSGRGRYRKVAWDEQQTQLAFVSDRDEAHVDAGDSPASHQAGRVPASTEEEPAGESPASTRAKPAAKFKLYRWERGPAGTAQELVSATTPGFRDGCQVSEHGTISFSRDGKHIFFGCAPAAAEEKPSDLPDDDKVGVDLWSWKDDYIQPMQKVRAELERTRTFRCVYHIAEKKMVQLGDRTMAEIVPSDDGLWAIGGDDREYRHMQEYDMRYVDSFLVNTRSGERKLLAKKHLGQVTWSPNGKWALYFNGKDWVTVSVPDGRNVTLTANLSVAFFEEDDDHPHTPPPYARANWTSDGRYVLLYDQFDLWRVAPDGSDAKNVTLGAGRKAHNELRIVRLNPDSKDPDARWVDATKPLLLRAENKDTRDTGFFRARLDAGEPPQKLLMAAQSFSSPVKAKNADVLLLTAQSFNQFPDVQIADMNLAKLEKVTNANPQLAQFTWGTAELVHYRNVNGVPLSGILYKPENFDARKKYPMLVYIYEKLSQNLNQFVEPAPSHRINAAYYVSNGYLVLMPDIVYNVGFPGQSALQCVLPAIDSVVAQGFVDEKAIGIQGHSWGGYQIAYMVTQTNRFRAVAAGAPVSNMTSAYDGIRWGPGIPRQFQYERDQSRIGGSLWEKPMRYIENSPIFMADRVQTPLLLLHNDADDAVPWYQGIEYYLALRRLSKEVYLFTYNGEPHGLRRRPNQKDYTVRLQQWFDHWLKGAPAPEWMEKGIPYLDRDQEKERLKAATGVY